MLYLVSTPIGNLKDISQRAKETLQTVNLVLCEDTRTTSKLMKLLEIGHYPPLLSYHEHNEKRRIDEVINRLKNKEDIALVAEAGTPTISDPGYKLVRECIRRGLEVRSVPGPSSVITALTVSGFPTDKFIYLGFLPRTAYKRRQLFNDLKQRFNKKKMTIIAFESPHRLVKSLIDLMSVFGDFKIAVCRELTKKFEKVTVESVSRLIKKAACASNKGEVTLVWEINSKVQDSKVDD